MAQDRRYPRSAGVITSADVSQLWTGHWPMPGTRVPAAELTGFRADALVIATCQRQLIVTADPLVAARAARCEPAEHLQGACAYGFLLEVAAGLRSAVPGETNVFGQFKRAWEAFRRDGKAHAVKALAPLIGQLVRDTRDIRRQHLQNIGGASYGGLVRRLIGPEPGDTILLVGAGELARSMLPFFRGFALGVWNRHAPEPAFAAAARVFAPHEGHAAARWARHVVMTTPADAYNDGLWWQWLRASAACTLVHLGRRREPAAHWPPGIRAYDLDDLFDLRRAQANIRSLQIEQARLACRALARRLAHGTAAPLQHRALA